MKIISGLKASEGVVIGRCYVLDRSKIKVKKVNLFKKDVKKEIAKFRSAIEKTEEYINHVKELSHNKIGDEHNFIFDVYLLFLKDDMLIGETERMIQRELVNAEYALKNVAANIVRIFSQSEDDYLKERKNDIEHISQKLIRFMSDNEYESVLDIEEGSIIIAHDIPPSDIAYMIKKKIKGFGTDLGSKVSHTSILARAVGITAVVGLEDITGSVESGDFIIIDGFEGKVIINPDKDILKGYKKIEKRYAIYKEHLRNLKDMRDVTTKDGMMVKLYSNIELNEEIEIGNEYCSGGIGLYRTEFIYLDKGDVGEDDQFNVLKDAAILNQGKPLVIRTFDLGGEKLSELLPHPEEQNPVMGLRAIRYSLRFKDFFKKQIRAILRASFYGDVRIMFPMISGIEEIDMAKEVIDEAKAELDVEGVLFKKDIPIGIMVELPSVALITDIAAKEVSFFSVGTNDLIQYTLGIDRNNEYVAYLYQPAHPAVIRLLKTIIQNGDIAGISTTVCGEMAGDPRYIPILLGIGFRELSMSPSLLLKAKLIISRLNLKECEKLVEKLSECRTSSESDSLLDEFIEDNAVDIYFQ